MGWTRHPLRVLAASFVLVLSLLLPALASLWAAYFGIRGLLLLVVGHTALAFVLALILWSEATLAGSLSTTTLAPWFFLAAMDTRWSCGPFHPLLVLDLPVKVDPPGPNPGPSEP